MRDARRGQVMVEYILIVAMIAGIILGVMWGLFRPRMQAMQADLEGRLPRVMSQRQLGIPLQWFKGGQGFDAVDKKLAAAQSGYKAGINAGGAGKGSTAGGSPKDDSGNNSQTGADNNSSSNNSKSSGKSSTSSESNASNEAAAPQGEKHVRRGGGSDDFSSGGGVKRDNPRGANVEGGEKAADNGGPAGANLKKAGTYNDREQERGGCGNMNLFTLLKIAAIVALLLLVAAVMVTGKGQKGKD